MVVVVVLTLRGLERDLLLLRRVLEELEQPQLHLQA